MRGRKVSWILGTLVISVVSCGDKESVVEGSRAVSGEAAETGNLMLDVRFVALDAAALDRLSLEEKRWLEVGDGDRYVVLSEVETYFLLEMQRDSAKGNVMAAPKTVLEVGRRYHYSSGEDQCAVFVRPTLVAQNDSFALALDPDPKSVFVLSGPIEIEARHDKTVLVASSADHQEVTEESVYLLLTPRNVL